MRVIFPWTKLVCQEAAIQDVSRGRIAKRGHDLLQIPTIVHIYGIDKLTAPEAELAPDLDARPERPPQGFAYKLRVGGRRLDGRRERRTANAAADARASILEP